MSSVLKSINILNSLILFFEKENWSFTLLKDKPTLVAHFEGEHGRWQCFAKAREEAKQFIFYSLCPVKVPLDKRPAVAELLMRVNSGMILGNWEMDYEDGEVRYKTSIDVKGDRLTHPVIKNLVYVNCRIMDKYLPGLCQVIFCNVTPKAAAAEIEDNP